MYTDTYAGAAEGGAEGGEATAEDRDQGGETTAGEERMGGDDQNMSGGSSSNSGGCQSIGHRGNHGGMLWLLVLGLMLWIRRHIMV